MVISDLASGSIAGRRGAGAPGDRAARPRGPVGDQAWSLDLVRNQAPFGVGDLRFSWEPGQASALDSSTIAEGVDVGNVLVERRSGAGREDAVYSVDFAFAFHAFYPEGEIHLE